MRTISLLAAVAALSITISAPVSAQDGMTRLGDFQTTAIASPERLQPVPKRCRYTETQTGYTPIGCTVEELREYLTATNVAVAPAPHMRQASYGGISSQEQARRDSLTFDEELRQKREAFDASLDDTRAERADQRQNRCEGRALGREVLGGLANAATNALESKLSRGRGYYYRGGYYPQGSNCSYRRY